MYKITIGNLVYPEVYLSNSIKDVMMLVPQIPIQEPVKPTPPSPPLKPEKRNDTSFFGCMSVIVVVTLILMISNWDKMKGEAFTAIPLLLIVGIICIPLFFSLLNNGDGYEEELSKYYEELRKFPQRQQEYKFLLEKYEQDQLQYKSLYNRIMSPAKLSEFRGGIIREKLKTLQPYFMDIEDTDVVKKGASESYFVGVLQHFFWENLDSEVITDKKVPVGETFYYPDIILRTPNGIYIDIEIDEPYNGATGEPIHYIANGLSIDYKRNKFFQEHGWVVVRFSEKQIFDNPRACVEFLIQLESCILEMSFEDLCASDDFVCPKWNEKLSHMWAYRKYRDSYVPQEYLRYISAENWEKMSVQNREQIGKTQEDDFYNDDLPF